MTDTRAPQVIKVVRAALLASLTAASVAACAGGGGGGGGGLPPPPITPPPPPTVPPPPAPPPPLNPPAFYETSEYFGSFSSGNHSGLGQVGASTAYSKGATGQGIIVAVIDTNVDTTISELTGQIFATHDVYTTRSGTDIDTGGHGTLVSSVIVANKNNVGIHGIAYEAKVLAIRADSPNSCADTTPDGGCSFATRHWQFA